MRSIPATPKLCPKSGLPTASRRSLLTGALPAVVALSAAPALAAPNPDAQLLADFAEWRALRKINDSDACTEESESREFDLYNTIPAMVPHTPAGILVLTAYAAFVATDVGARSNPHHKVHTAFQSLGAAKTEVPALADVVDFAMESVDSTMRNLETTMSEWFKAGRKAEEWKRIEEVFDRNGATERLEENGNRRDPVRSDEIEQTIADALKVMSPEKIQSYLDYVTLIVLTEKIDCALENLSKRFDHAGDLIRAKAKRFAEMAAALPVTPVA